MGELAYFSTVNQDILYKEFGVDAELLIDHAWGLEPCGMKEIKAYKPSTNSISEGQVLSCPYPYDKARIIVMEMADSLALQLTDKGLVTDSLTLDVGYDRENCDSGKYSGPVHIDHYGRTVPKGAHLLLHFIRHIDQSEPIEHSVDVSHSPDIAQSFRAVYHFSFNILQGGIILFVSPEQPCLVR